jgi:predicted small secreted protein
MKKLLTLLSLAVFAVTLTACNTLEGAGEDVEAGGEAVQDVAE